MSNSDGRITRPVNFADVQKVLGRSFNDEGMLCTSDNINKWSKSKPYNYSSLSPLVDTEKKGTPAQNAEGIFYGLKAISVAGKLSELHNATYEYVGVPKGSADSPYRISDFDGYDDNAVPTISGTIPDEAYYNVAKNFACIITYDYLHNNTTGVDIAEIINDIADATKFDSYYPCILVGSYARGLFNTSTETQTSIYYGSAWYQNFYCDFDGYPNLSDGVKTCTVFFIKQLYIQGVIDLRSWQNVSGIVSTINGFTVPNAIAVECQLKYYSPYPVLKVTGVNNTGSGLMLLLGFEGDAPQTNTNFVISFSSPGTANINFPYNATYPNLAINVTWAQLGLLQAPSSPFSVSGSISTSGHVVSNFNFVR